MNINVNVKIEKLLSTHRAGASLLQLPDVGDPADAVAHQEHPRDGQADLGVADLGRVGTRASNKPLHLFFMPDYSNFNTM